MKWKKKKKLTPHFIYCNHFGRNITLITVNARTYVLQLGQGPWDAAGKPHGWMWNDGINPVSNSSSLVAWVPRTLDQLLDRSCTVYPSRSWDLEIPSNNDNQLVWIMPALDAIGKIAAAQIAFYTPVAAITLFLIFRYAFRRDGGWFWLFIFSAGNPTAFYIILFCFI